jgi:prophage antirepressor-like protein
METKLAIFKGKEIRRTLHNDEWWFAIVDVVLALTDSVNPSGYIKDMRKRDVELARGWGQIATPLAVKTAGGMQKINCANTEGIFRIIQSIPSPKAEPFKRWLAKVGYERVQEIENPELASKRTKALYREKGYSEAWIEKRMRGIVVRAELTDEWKMRGIKEQPEYAILTSEISKAAFGMTPSEYKTLKRLDRENLRDHMTDLELIFSMLGEAATTEIARKQNAQEFSENKIVAQKGGKIAGDAREKLEIETGKDIISDENYLQEPESKKRITDNK